MQICFDFAERENISRNPGGAIDPHARPAQAGRKPTDRGPGQPGRPEESRQDKGPEASGATKTGRGPGRGLWRVMFSSWVLSP